MLSVEVGTGCVPRSHVGALTPMGCFCWFVSGFLQVWALGVSQSPSGTHQGLGQLGACTPGIPGSSLLWFLSVRVS